MGRFAGWAPAAATDVYAYKRIPADVLEPIMQMLSWLLWSVLLLCLAWLIVSAGRFWTNARSGSLLDNDAAHGAVMSLVGALVASSASAIALAILPS